MSAKGLRSLETELGGRAPDRLEALSDEQLSEFSGLLRAAKTRQSDALQSAVEQALEIVPRMLRGPVRKILFG
jgi:hypothetical protein